MDNRRVRRVSALIAALVGGYLLQVAADRNAGAALSFWAFLTGLVVLLAVLVLLLRWYRPGQDEPSSDEVAVREWRAVRFLRRAVDAAPLYVGIRLFLAWQWIDSGRGKLTNPAWIDTGEALSGFWTRALGVPAQGSPPIVYPAYRSLIQYMLDHAWYTWFAKVIAISEVLIGVGLLLGAFTGIAAFFGLLLNFSFVYAGTVSSNPTLIILQALIAFLGWRVAGYYGLDRWLLPLLGTPWNPAPRAVRQAREPTEPDPVGPPGRR